MQLADCDDWFKSGCGGKNGIYMINPDGGEPFEVMKLSVHAIYYTCIIDFVKVFCEMRSDGGGWIVFQRRLDGSVDFYLNWSEYRNGFGNLTNEFWLGLDKIHRLTMKSSSLRVDLEDFDGGKGHAKYSKFAVGDEASKYELTVNGYSGNAGDALKIHNGHMFTTKDNDNDLLNGVNCAGTFYGAWWYDNCYDSNLNGIYKQGPSSNSTAIIWKKWNNTSLKYTEMKVRKVL